MASVVALVVVVVVVVVVAVCQTRIWTVIASTSVTWTVPHHCNLVHAQLQGRHMIAKRPLLVCCTRCQQQVHRRWRQLIRVRHSRWMRHARLADCAERACCVVIFDWPPLHWPRRRHHQLRSLSEWTLVWFGWCMFSSVHETTLCDIHPRPRPHQAPSQHILRTPSSSKQSIRPNYNNNDNNNDNNSNRSCLCRKNT